jgi:hypothetical protein
MRLPMCKSLVCSIFIKTKINSVHKSTKVLALLQENLCRIAYNLFTAFIQKVHVAVRLMSAKELSLCKTIKLIRYEDTYSYSCLVLFMCLLQQPEGCADIAQ